MMFRLGEDKLRLIDIGPLLEHPDRTVLSAERARLLDQRRRAVMERVARGDRIYGINTGFGKLKDRHISADQMRELQVRLVRSHAVGTGPPLPPDIARLILLLRAHTLAYGYSAVRAELVAFLQTVFQQKIVPWIPAQGSVGASGDLAPLAHMALMLIGEGACWVDGRMRPAAEILAAHGLTPLTLEAREGLALINGTQASTAVLAVATLRAFETLALANLAGAMTIDAAQGSIHPTDPPVVALRPYPAFVQTAHQIRQWLRDSEILESHRACGRIQDNYSLRCMLQVHGTVLEGLRFIQRILETEMNSVTDNPLFLPDGTPVYNGNFHGAPIAMAADLLATVMATLGSITERRIFHLMTPEMSGLPPFLTPEPGLNSGYMMFQVTAASLVNENQTLAHPASIDTVPTSGNQEDHVSMSMWAARKALQVVENTRTIVAIELICSAQGIELRRPLRSGPAIERVLSALRRIAPFHPHDTLYIRDLTALQAWLDTLWQEPWFHDAVTALLETDDATPHRG